jgi:hypothetical protein
MFLCFIFQEINESIKWGIENALNVDVLALSILSLVGILINHKLNKLIISIVLSYFIWMLISRHFPAYPEYQAFTVLFNNLGLKSIEFQKLFHISFYIGLLISALFINLKETNTKNKYT